MAGPCARSLVEAGSILIRPGAPLVCLRKLAVAVACCIGLAAVFVPAQRAAAQQGDLKVMVSSKPIHALVAAVMKDVGTPDLLVEGSTSPHTYALRPSDMSRLNKADVFFRVSEALEPFTSKVVRSLPRKVKVATLVQAPGIKLLQRRSGGPFEVHKHSHGHGHSHGKHKHATAAGGNYDAHVWLDPDNAKAMVEAIAAILAERAPQSAEKIRANATALNARLDEMAGALRVELAPFSAKPFVVLHDAYQYFERRFGLNAIGSILVDPDEQPSVKRISDLRRKVTELKAVCVFAEPGHQPRVVDSVIEGTTSRTAVLDPEGTMLEPGPELYFKLMRQIADGMKGCLATPA